MIEYEKIIVILHLLSLEFDYTMAKIGYILSVTNDDRLVTDKEWMQQYGCIRVIEENAGHEKMRPMWHQLLPSLERGDELVVSKFSNAVRGVRELAALIEFCRVKVVRLISLHDKIDTGNEMFLETSSTQVMEMFGSLPEEVAVLRRRTSSHAVHQLQTLTSKPNVTIQDKTEREKTIVSMYNNNHSIDDIWAVSGFKSRSSVFRILKKYGVQLNRRLQSPVE